MIAASRGCRASSGANKLRASVGGRDRGVAGVDHHGDARVGQQPPHRVELRLPGREAANLEVDLEDGRPIVDGPLNVAEYPGLGVERRRRQAAGCGLGERQGPVVQVLGHVGPVRVGERAEHPHAHRARCAIRSPSVHR